MCLRVRDTVVEWGTVHLCWSWVRPESWVRSYLRDSLLEREAAAVLPDSAWLHNLHSRRGERSCCTCHTSSTHAVIMHSKWDVCTQRWETNTNWRAEYWQWQMLAKEWAGKEHFHFIFASFGFHGEKNPEQAVVCLSHYTLWSSLRLWLLLVDFFFPLFFFSDLNAQPEWSWKNTAKSLWCLSNQLWTCVLLFLMHFLSLD